MAELKTKQTRASVTAFLNTIEEPRQRADVRKIAAIMRDVTGSKARMWGTSMIGFGYYDYKYESGREGRWFLCGLSPRKNSLSIYIMAGFERFDGLLGQLGKYKTGKSCLYIKSLDDIDIDVLRQLIEASVEHMRSHYATG